MPLTKEEKKSITLEIREALASHVKQVHSIGERTGWNRASSWAKEWGILGAAATFVVGMVGCAIAVILFALAEWRQLTEFRVHTDDRLGNVEDRLSKIESVLGELRTDLARVNLVNHAALPQDAFKNALLGLDQSLTTLRQQKAEIPTPIIEDLSKRLAATDSNAPGYWPAAGALISYHSFLVVGTSVNWTKTFPPCRGTVDLLGADKNATAQFLNKEGKPISPKAPIMRLGEQDCNVDLDGKTVSRWDCTRCLIRYSGGPVSLTDVRLQGCLFVFNLHGKPASANGERFIEQALASNPQNVIFTGN